MARIWIDFDDVLAMTTQQFVNVFNKETGRNVQYNDLNDWYLPRVLDVEKKVIDDIYNELDYDMVLSSNLHAPTYLNELMDRGHEVAIVTANKRERSVRDWLNDRGMRRIPLISGVGNKAGLARQHYCDLMVDDKVSTVKGMNTVGVHTILYSQPWNVDLDTLEYEYVRRADTWSEIIDLIEEFLLQETPQDEVITYPNGAKQSVIKGRFDLLPPLALKQVAVVLEGGANKYGDNNWRGIQIDQHLNHAMLHLVDYNVAANTEDLANAATRLLMALDLHLEAEGIENDTVKSQAFLDYERCMDA